MGKRGPQPKSNRVRTKLIRIDPDLAIMLAAVCRYEGITSAEFFDSRLRGELEAAFEKIRPVIEQMAKTSPVARAKLQEVIDARAEVEAARHPEGSQPKTHPKRKKAESA